MSKEITDTCESLLKMAKDAGAADSRVSFNKRRFVEVRYREREPETVKEALTQNMNLEIFVDGRYCAQDTSDLRKEALKSFVINAIESARPLEEDPYRSLPDPGYYEGRRDLDLKICDPEYEKISPELRHTMAKEIEEACMETGGDRVISVIAQVYDEFNEEITLTSNGFLGETESTTCYAYGEMTAQDQGDRRPTGYYYPTGRAYGNLPSCGEVGKEAALKTLELMGGKKIATETLPVIIENRNVQRMLYGFLSAMDGQSLQQQRSFLLDKKGKKIGSNIFTLIDDPHVIGGLGSRLYDNDGFATKRRTMVEKGVLNEYYIDWYRSRKLEVEPTTGTSSNLILAPGKRSVGEIIKDLGRGIIINGFMGGNSNSNTGDFSVGITGRLFEKGEFIQAVAEMNIADNHLQFWNKLAEAANDPWIYGNFRMPSLVFTDIVVSGL